MASFTERMMGAAKLDVQVYEEVEADRSTTSQAMGVGLPRFRGRVRTWVSSALLQLSPLVVDG